MIISPIVFVIVVVVVVVAVVVAVKVFGFTPQPAVMIRMNSSYLQNAGKRGTFVICPPPVNQSS